MADCLIAFGSNQGDSLEIFETAHQLLSEIASFGDVLASKPLTTKAIGSSPSGQPDYINGAFRLTTDLEPQQLLENLLAIEQQLGRERHERWGARKIDLDLLLYDDLVEHTEFMTVPHPRMSFRRFVLEPASEIAADMIHPQCAKFEDDTSQGDWMTVGDLLARINMDSSALLWLTSQKKRAGEFVDLLRADYQDWDFHIMDYENLIPFEDEPPSDPKLVVIDTVGYRTSLGPRLNLCDSPKTMFETEIRAALDAIKP